MLKLKNMIFLLFPFVALFVVSCGGTLEATPDMTMSVSPSSISIEDAEPNTKTSKQNLVISVFTADNKPATDVKVYAEVPSSFVDQGLFSFTYCPNTNKCTCTIDNDGRCTIEISYQHGGGLAYKLDINVYSGGLFQAVSLEVK